ncbi:hypothetical protein ACIRPT_23855 [Streptomyces sp. NPDC101227]|uniref:hypothetical protein n=1 Tax=Streptomyces sp. NPDC101227 TaxID=3366136 RepID=UPI0037FD310E
MALRYAGEHIAGRGGLTIQDAWRDDMTARRHDGTTVHPGSTVTGFRVELGGCRSRLLDPNGVNRQPYPGNGTPC